MLQFRASLDQAGRVAGLAAELGISDSQVMRMLVDRALVGPAPQLLRELRATVAEDARHLEDEIERHREHGR